MRFSTRAGGVAAAVFLLSLGIFNPTPSRAWEMNDPAVTSPTPAPALPAPAAVAAPLSSTPATPAVEAAPVAPVAADIAQPRTIDAPRRALADSIEAYAATAAGDAEQDCLATAVYFEAKGE